MGVPGDLRALAPAACSAPAAWPGRRPSRVMPKTPVTEDVAVGEYIAAPARPRGRRPARRTAARRRLRGPRRQALAARHRPAARPAGRRRDPADHRRARALPRARPPRRPPARRRSRCSPESAAAWDGCPALIAADVAGAARICAPTTAVRALRRTETGWRPSFPTIVRWTATPSCSPSRGYVARELLAEHAPSAAAELGEIEYASMAITTFAFHRSALAGRAARLRLPGAPGGRPRDQGRDLLQRQVALARAQRGGPGHHAHLARPGRRDRDPGT